VAEQTEQIKKKLAAVQWGVDTSAKSILLVDDEIRMAQDVKVLLEKEGYTVTIVPNGKRAMEEIKENPPDLVLAEIVIRHVNGFDLCRYIKTDPITKDIPVILITGLQRPDDKIKGIHVGANDFIGKPFDPMELKVRVASALEMKMLQATLVNVDEVIFAFSRAVEARDPYTRGHSERVGRYAMRLAAALGLDAAYQAVLMNGAILHDIGKIGVRDSVLLKGDRLTQDEFEEIKKHPAIGLQICAPLKSSRPLLNIIAYHHEKMDGSGYPYGLIGNTIPFEARIAAIADTFDALTSDRPYRKALRTVEACHILESGIETHYDEDILPIFIDIALRGELANIPNEVQDGWNSGVAAMEGPVRNLKDFGMLSYIVR
jgi:putative two-component system response regulator